MSCETAHGRFLHGSSPLHRWSTTRTPRPSHRLAAVPRQAPSPAHNPSPSFRPFLPRGSPPLSSPPPTPPPLPSAPSFRAAPLRFLPTRPPLDIFRRAASGRRRAASGRRRAGEAAATGGRQLRDDGAVLHVSVEPQLHCRLLRAALRVGTRWDI